jgi:hypothetical protein
MDSIISEYTGEVAVTQLILLHGTSLLQVTMDFITGSLYMRQRFIERKYNSIFPSVIDKAGRDDVREQDAVTDATPGEELTITMQSCQARVSL